MLFDLALFLVAALMVFPFISAYYAYTHGRSFWLWFFIGSVLPIIAYFILLILPDKTHPLEKEMEEIRLKNGILGTRPEFAHQQKRLSKHLAESDYLLSFLLEKTPEQETAIPLINGKPLVEMLQLEKEIFGGIPLKIAQPPSYHLIGNPSLFFRNKKGKAAILASYLTGGTEEAALYATIELYPQHIVWSDFDIHPRQKKRNPLMDSPIIFKRLQYMEALSTLENAGNQH